MKDSFLEEHDEIEPLIVTDMNGMPNSSPNSGVIRHREEVPSSNSRSKQHQFGQDYTYVSSTNFSTPPDVEKQQHKRQLQSQPFGGLGPVQVGDNHDGDGSKLKSQTLYNRITRKCTNCLRANGCSSHAMIETEGPNGDFYRDNFNDQTHACAIGTGEEDGIWMNRNDGAGSIMACMVWFLFLYSCITITFLAETGGIHGSFSMIYAFLCGMSLMSHAKTQFTDPGTVPASAQPVEAFRRMNPSTPLTMCSQCQSFKPPFSHHCRICNRCISRMDHHCPWMNTCVGAGNLKHFILFLTYTWLCNALALSLLGWNYFFCVSEECTFTILLVQLARITTMLSTMSLLFTSSMIMNVTYGVMTGIGTIDRLKKKAMDTMMMSEEEPILLKDIFGIGGFHTWPFPIDPIFEDFDRVMGFSTPQRLLREQMKDKNSRGGGTLESSGASIHTTPSYHI